MSNDDTEIDFEIELSRLCHAWDAGRLQPIDALRRAYALGAELERLSAMRRACEEYDRAREARHAAFKAERSSRPPRGG